MIHPHSKQSKRINEELRVEATTLLPLQTVEHM